MPRYNYGRKLKHLQNELRILYKNPNELKLNTRNSRTHSKKQLHQIAKSIEAFGFNNPVLIDESDTIIAGHGRVLAALVLNLELVPTICLKDKNKHIINRKFRILIS